jgi:hypothetical protein
MDHGGANGARSLAAVDAGACRKAVEGSATRRIKKPWVGAGNAGSSGMDGPTMLMPSMTRSAAGLEAHCADAGHPAADRVDGRTLHESGVADRPGRHLLAALDHTRRGPGTG